MTFSSIKNAALHALNKDRLESISLSVLGIKFCYLNIVLVNLVIYGTKAVIRASLLLNVDKEI